MAHLRQICLPDVDHQPRLRIFDLWLACHTQEEIAEAVGVERSSIAKMGDDFVKIGNLSEIHKPAALHQVDFEVPLYNVWKQQEKTNGTAHTVQGPTLAQLS